MSVLNVKPKFLYPHSRQFPFDAVAEKIVRALEKRNWKVPGITVEFYTYGSGEAKYKKVQYIKGEDFKLYFCRCQGRLSYNRMDTAALHEASIPKQSIAVFDDESGPVYYLYVGKDWEQDKKWFMNSIKVNSKLDNKPRRYLKYKGNTYSKRATALIHDSDLGREYSPEGSEPRAINLEEKLKEFSLWLENHVLKYILSFPEQDATEDVNEQLIPYTGPWITIYSLCNCEEAESILKGKNNPNELPMEDRHASFSSYCRLVSLGVKSKGELPQLAYDGFIWCDVNQNITRESKKEAFLDSVYRAMGNLFRNNYIVAVKLKYANDVYVVDNAKFDETRFKLFEAIAPRERLTDNELNQAYVARGKTIVPITEYKGGYKEPIVLIRRELDFDEIEWIAYNR